MSLSLSSAPFVLLEDARPNAAPARLYTQPVETIVAWTLDEVEPALAKLAEALKGGRHVAGWMSYEAGIAFEQRLIKRAQREGQAAFPLVWFGVFDAPIRIAPERVPSLLADPEAAWISQPNPRMSQREHQAAFERAMNYIVAGDIYQVNLSYRADLQIEGHPLAAYARLRQSGQGGWSGALFDGARWLLSTSPELFFRLSNGTIEARPMKGTAKRGADAEADRAAAAALREDPKELAENVMIVDLIRNDLSRIAKPGTVRTPDLFTVETYPTLHTLTSTVRAELRDDLNAIDVIRALFPCGSITGAPKIRAMEIIRELEGDSRGAYTGAIGWISPDGDAEFNVAIRTLAIADGKAELGIGSAIVYDSTASSEWEECQTKSAFVLRGAAEFGLIETMRFDGASIARLDLHLARLSASAQRLGFECDADLVERRARAAVAKQVGPCVVRLELSRDGALDVALSPMRRFRHDTVEAAVAQRPVATHDFRLRHKTTVRSFYDDARTSSGAEEVLLVDDEGFVTEGSFTNVFVERGGVLLTPPLSRGLLPGILRRALIDEGRAVERDLRLSDLAAGFLIGNAVRGLVPAVLKNRVRTSTRSAERTGA